MKIVITGATGYIGQHFIQHTLNLHHITALSRHAPLQKEIVWLPYDLINAEKITLPSGTDIVLHLAVSTEADNNLTNETDIAAAVALLKSTLEIDAQFIFVSSQTAREDAPTSYGRTKWHIEQKVLAAGGIVVRPGQVYGGLSKGLFGKMITLVQRLPLLPAFLPSPKIQPIHIDDLILGILRIAEQRQTFSARVFCLGSAEPISFSSFLQAIARYRLHKWRIFLPTPTFLINVTEYLLGKRAFLEQLHSLFNLPLMDTKADLHCLQLSLRSLPSGMSPIEDSSHQALREEGAALLRYILKIRPDSALSQRYVQAIEALRHGKSLELPKLFIHWPILLALIDNGNNKNPWKNEFMWRLDAAMVLAEATPLGAKQFLGVEKHQGVIVNILGIMNAVFSELIWRLCSALVTPLIKRLLPSVWKSSNES